MHAAVRRTAGADLQAAFRNQGGFHMIGSGRGKIEKAEDLQRAADVAQELRLDGLIVCGGDDSNTNAAILAEFFKSKGDPSSSSSVQHSLCDGPSMLSYRLTYGTAIESGLVQQTSCHAGLHTSVIGVPKTIDGDLKNAQVATSFGFDTACKVRPYDARPDTGCVLPTVPAALHISALHTSVRANPHLRPRPNFPLCK